MSKAARVMCVEDDPDIRTILQFSLEIVGGYQVAMCPDGFAALETAKEFAPDLVLMDVMMPGLTGPQTLGRLRELPSMAGVPCVFITAKAMAHEVEALLRQGASGVVVKPFDPVTLPQQVRVYLDQGGD
jgi:CheY-like chemotaxis protein